MRPYPIPRFAVPATDRPSYGGALAGTAAKLGVPLLGWQEYVAGAALEHEGGQLTYRDVIVSTPRQSGKSTLVLALIVARMLAASGQVVVYGAQTRLAARTKLFDRWWPRLRRSPLRDVFTLTRATGAESLRSANGSVTYLLSADEGASQPWTWRCWMNAGGWMSPPSRRVGRRWRPGRTASCGCCPRRAPAGQCSGGRRWTLAAPSPNWG